MTNVSVNWEWYDDIDAYNFMEALNEYERGVSEWSWFERRLASIGLSIEAFWDVLGDHVADTDFRVKINWAETRNQPFKIVR